MTNSNLVSDPTTAGISNIPYNCELVTAQITSLVRNVCVAEGTEVAKGDTIAVLEAMKANFRVPAPASGLLTKLIVSEGEMVQLGGSITMIKLINKSTLNQSNSPSMLNMSSNRHSLQFETLRSAYKSGTVSPSGIIEQIFLQIQADGGSKKGNI